MARTVSIGHQSFEQLITNNYFYIDKTMFIKDWWENGDAVTLITRPRRFGKTLNLDMVDYFFSVEHSGKEDLFQNLSIWKEEKYRRLQGTFPVITISFANVKEVSFTNARKSICQIIENLYNKYDFLLESGHLNSNEQKTYRKVSANMEDYLATNALNALSDYLMRYYGKKVIILLDEYTTFSYFDTGKHPSGETEPERFYHGFVLGLMVDLADRYTITSNRESGFGRYDVMLEPLQEKDDAIILEFKVHDSDDGNTLMDTVPKALEQIERKKYSAMLEAKGIAPERIRRYGFAFKGKTVLIG